MKIAIYSRRFDNNLLISFKELYTKSCAAGAEIYLYEPLYKYVVDNHIECSTCSKFFSQPDEISEEINFFVSLGGDGTFLHSVSFIRNKNIPIIGVNVGRLGFLADIPRSGISKSMNAIFSNEYFIEKRTLLEFQSPKGIFDDFPYALNDITIQKKGTSIVTIHIYLENQLLNTYWTDGLIISTPTGSTAYSLSAGGPIVAPDCENFIISPIASHNLSVRPFVISDKNTIKLKVESRTTDFLATLDYKTAELSTKEEITIKKADFKINIIKPRNHSFFNTISEKLLWGKDKRNYT